MVGILQGQQPLGVPFVGLELTDFAHGACDPGACLCGLPGWRVEEALDVAVESPSVSLLSSEPLLSASYVPGLFEVPGRSYSVQMETLNSEVAG